MTDDLLYVRHILDCIERIQRYTRAGKDAFLSETLIQDGVVRNLQVLAESSMRVSDGVKARTPEVPWRAMAGFRNVAVHDYLGLDLARIWDIVDLDLPALKENLARLGHDLTPPGRS